MVIKIYKDPKNLTVKCNAAQIRQEIHSDKNQAEKLHMFAQLGLICNVSKVRINKLHILNIYPPAETLHST